MAEKKTETAALPERMPLSQREYCALRMLFGVISSFSLAASDMEARVKSIPGAWRDYRMLQVVAGKLLDRILLTIPLKKLLQIRTELAHTKVMVEVKRDYCLPVKDNYEDMITYVPQRALERITQQVVDCECVFCEKAGKDAKRCQLRRDIEAAYHWEYPDGGQECPFAGWVIDDSREG